MTTDADATEIFISWILIALTIAELAVVPGFGIALVMGWEPTSAQVAGWLVLAVFFTYFWFSASRELRRANRWRRDHD